MSAERYQWLANLKCNHFHLTRNDENAANYMTAEEWIASEAGDFEDVPEEELAAMKATNTIWSLQIYPDTPIGFYVWLGATLDSVIDRAMLHFAASRTP